MATKVATPAPIDIMPGVQPPTDYTRVKTKHYTDSRGIRFQNSNPQKIGGNIALEFDYDATITGTTRSIFTDLINGNYRALIGTDAKLYSIIGSRLTNITPFVTSSTAAANSLATQYGTLSANPFTSVSGSPVLTVADSNGASRYRAGDTVYYSGATGFAGISAGAINGDNIVRSVNALAGTYTINVVTNANASTAGGGASVIRSSGLINVTKNAHGLANGARVKIAGASTTGGVTNTLINAEHIIRNVATNTFDIMTTGDSTSSVTAGGGGSTVYYIEIPVGNVNETATQGYGAGLYGVGLYGTALVSSSARSYPRIWFFGRYANTFVMTPGNQTGVYQWFGSNATAPALVANAPIAVNYIFVSNNILVTLGAGGIENRIFASDQNDITNWTSSSTNQVFDDDIEGASRLLSHCPAENINLIFTQNKTYTFRYIGLPLIWEILPLDDSVGIIAPMARVSAKGVAFWMGQENFYMYRGGKVEIIPANSQAQSTALRYVFDNLNYGQKSKIFAWYNKEFNEIWFHYPSAASNEPDRIIRVNLLDYTWVIDEMDRTAAEWPAVTLKNPLLANVGTIYKHEFGTDDNGSPLEFTLTGNLRYYGKNNLYLSGIVPDSIQTGDVTFNVTGYRFPQSTNYTQNLNFTVSEDTEQIQVPAMARFYDYTWSGAELGQDWIMGEWFEQLQDGPTQ